MKKILLLLTLLLVFIGCGGEKEVKEEPLLKHEIVNINTMGKSKYAADIIIETREGQLPSERLLQEIAQHYKKANPGYDNYFFGYRLPGMDEDIGIAVANNVGDDNEELEVEYVLMNFLSVDESFMEEIGIVEDDFFTKEMDVIREQIGFYNKK